MKLLGIAGSLRAGSYNACLIRAAAETAPDGTTVTLFERLGEIPLYNDDEKQKAIPDAVTDLAERIRGADGVLIATPEYNYGVPGVLKNAIDWLSRPEGDSPIFGKPVAIIGASISRIGTARAQAHLRSIAFYNGLPLLPTSEVLVAKAQEKFDEKGNLTDEDTKYFMRDMLAKLADWVTLHRQGSAPS